jgi:hypothetical protein
MKLPEIKYQFVNWRDGMKITQQHLTASDNATRDAVRDSTAVHLNGHNYGLLASEDGSGTGLKINVMGDTIQLLSCRAITPGGIRVEWDAGEDTDAVSLSLLDYKNRLGGGGLFYVVLRMSLSGQVEHGKYDTEEVPLRKPFMTLKPMLELLPGYETLADAFSIPVFRVRFEGQLFVPDYDYIPPTTGVFGENLLWYYDTCGKQIYSLQQTSIQIVRKINGMQSQSPVSRDVFQLAQSMVHTGLQVIDEYKLISKEMPPVYFIHGLVRYARGMRTTLECLSENSSARLYQYLRNNVGGTTKFNMHVPEVSKSLMDSMIDSVLTNHYDHNDCNLLLDSIKGFLDFLEFVLQSLLALPYVDAAKWDIA